MSLLSGKMHAFSGYKSQRRNRTQGAEKKKGEEKDTENRGEKKKREKEKKTQRTGEKDGG